MTLHATILAALGTAALAAGCAGELTPGAPDDPAAGTPDAGDPGPDPGTGGSTARALYEANVHGFVVAACGSCHTTQVPTFVNTEVSQGYDKIMPYRDQLYQGFEPTTATLISYGDGSHNGASYPAGAVDAITAWLAAEKADATGGGTTASPLAIWSGCMSFVDWEAEGVADAWADKTANGQGNCDTCHNLGGDGFMASNVDARVFESITEIPALMPSYFTLDATGTSVIINRTRFESVGNRLDPHQEHGGFTVDGDAMDRLTRFYNLTAARLAAGQCEAPRFPQ